MVSRGATVVLIVCVVGCGASVAPLDGGASDGGRFDAPAPDVRDGRASVDVSDAGAADTAEGCLDASSLCGGRCVDTQSSVDHCGACDAPCRSRNNAVASCVMGACRNTCVAGFGDCDNDALNGCETSLGSPMHCGACGRVCTGATPICLSALGQCTAPCSGGQSVCRGMCVDTNTDVSNCGGCGRACPARANSVASCALGLCRARCDEGFADCDGASDNGCEASLSGVLNCGACGRACAAGQRCCDGVCASGCP